MTQLEQANKLVADLQNLAQFISEHFEGEEIKTCVVVIDKVSSGVMQKIQSMLDSNSLLPIADAAYT